MTRKLAGLMAIAVLIMTTTTGLIICKMDAEKKEKEAQIEEELLTKDELVDEAKENLERWKESQRKFIKLAQERSEKIETLEEEIKKLKTENAGLQPNRTSNSKQASRGRNTQKNFTGSVERWRPLVAKYFPANQVNNALAVMKGESGGNPNSINDNPRTRDYSVGLFQINLYGKLAKSRPSEAWLLIPENNIAYASRVWKNQGWTPWSYARKIGL